jgi:hypothetical protein
MMTSTSKHNTFCGIANKFYQRYASSRLKENEYNISRNNVSLPLDIHPLVASNVISVAAAFPQSMDTSGKFQ